MKRVKNLCLTICVWLLLTVSLDVKASNDVSLPLDGWIYYLSDNAVFYRTNGIDTMAFEFPPDFTYEGPYLSHGCHAVSPDNTFYAMPPSESGNHLALIDLQTNEYRLVSWPEDIHQRPCLHWDTDGILRGTALTANRLSRVEVHIIDEQLNIEVIETMPYSLEHNTTQSDILEVNPTHPLLIYDTLSPILVDLQDRVERPIPYHDGQGSINLPSGIHWSPSGHYLAYPRMLCECPENLATESFAVTDFETNEVINAGLEVVLDEVYTAQPWVQWLNNTDIVSFWAVRGQMMFPPNPIINQPIFVTLNPATMEIEIYEELEAQSTRGQYFSPDNQYMLYYERQPIEAPRHPDVIHVLELATGLHQPLISAQTAEEFITIIGWH